MTLNKNTGMPKNGNLGRLIAKDIINNTNNIQIIVGNRELVDNNVVVNGLPLSNLATEEDKLNFINNGGMASLSANYGNPTGSGIILVINSQWQIYFEESFFNKDFVDFLDNLKNFVNGFITGSIIGSNGGGSVVVDPTLGQIATDLLPFIDNLKINLP